MKKLYTLLAIIATIATFAQAPQGFNYQATVRNSTGALIVNQNVYFKFNLMLNSASSVPVFSETHYTPTDDLGQVNIVIGQGTATVGTFSTINWGTGNYYLGIELNTGSGYIAMGTTQLLSVPYALYANSSGNAPTSTPNLAAVLAVNNGANNLKISNLANPTAAQDAATKNYVDSKIPNGTNAGDNLTWNGTNWVVSSASTTAQLPVILTIVATNTLTPSPSSGGTITSDGGYSITSKGVFWSTSPNPTINNNSTNNGTGASNFTSVLSNLSPTTTYYYRAYATNSIGTGYGITYTFTTAAIPQLTTTILSTITGSTASSGGTISNDGGASIIEKGVCWSTSPNPTITLTTKTNNGNGNGLFTSSISGLIPNTLYYVRAYATNSFGTAYGQEEVFTTATIPQLTTTIISTITSFTASSGGIISSDGRAIITAKGVCWSTSINPTIALTTKTNDGTGTATFTSSINGLEPITTYYVRAYATNSVGTAYGTELSFTTGIIPTITNGSQYWQTINLDVSTYRDGTPIPQVTDPTAWGALTTGAWCYYNNTTANGTTYGKLYNWYAVAGIHDNDPNTPNKTLAPTGSHVPTDAEWTTLTTYLGGENIAGGKMKSTGTTLWNWPNTGATNSSGFTGFPGGDRNQNGEFGSLRGSGIWWSSSENGTQFANTRGMNLQQGQIYNSSVPKNWGLSVRLVRD